MNKIASAAAALCMATVTLGQTSPLTDLQQGFATPPNAAMPRVWWHWMNGNISKNGIRKDLEWMHRSGIGGFQNFDAGMTTPQIVDKRLTYMTPEWQDAFRFTTQLADSLKLEMAIAGSPGWSESGGPWVQPKDGMKKIVWSKTLVRGGQPFAGRLSQPPTATGPFQNIPYGDALSDPSHGKVPTYYGDIGVVAYRLPAQAPLLADLKPEITSSGGSFTLAQLTDGDVAAASLLPKVQEGQAWIQYAFAQPQTIKAVTVVGGGDKGPFGLFGDKAEDRALEVSDDGNTFRRICFIPAGGVVQQTITIPPTTARYFRVTFKNPPPKVDLAAMLSGSGMPTSTQVPGTDVAELVLHPVSVIDRYEEKAGYAAYAANNIKGHADAADAVDPANVVDLTGKVNADGSLNWTPPPGNWKVVRFGYTLTGKQNHPASPEATGLEVDKLDRDAVRAYFEYYLDQYQSATGKLMGARGLQYMITDSYESGQENWTPALFAEFRRRRGYDMLPWMPVLTGTIIESHETSEQFLWDFRKTIAELVAENHYDQLTDILAKRGMKRYTESHEGGRAYIVDGMDVKRTAAVPMSAMWTPGAIGGDGTGYQADIRESASVAHIYGQNLAAAESLTAFGMTGNAFSYAPENLKPTADLELANGLNRFVIHTSVHQPSDEKFPGLSLGPFGQWFTRHETWANQAKTWTDYLSRSSYMLQQGKFVADIVYYYGEDNNITSLYGKKLPDIPEGYNYDFINAHALINLLQVKNGKLVTPSGMQYRVLALDSNSRSMTLQVARKLRELVRAGAVVVGPKPTHTPSMKDDRGEFASIIEELWSANAGGAKVRIGQSIQEALNELKVVPDFGYAKPKQDSKLLFVHRTLPGAEVYWVNNRNNRDELVEARFRVSGKEAEIWHPETGKIEKASFSSANGITTVPLALTPNDAVFVVFRNTTTKSNYAAPKAEVKNTLPLEGSWNVSFQQGRGAPASSNFDKLQSFTEHSEEGIKYYSGTATYTKSVEVPAAILGGGGKVQLDLGAVKNIAAVRVNGKEVGTVWKAPFVVDVTSALKAGSNTVEVRVTNLWVNRLIGDQQPNVKEKITYVTLPFYQANSKLLPSGLVGPVKLFFMSGK